MCKHIYPDVVGGPYPKYSLPTEAEIAEQNKRFVRIDECCWLARCLDDVLRDANTEHVIGLRSAITIIEARQAQLRAENRR